MNPFDQFDSHAQGQPEQAVAQPTAPHVQDAGNPFDRFDVQSATNKAGISPDQHETPVREMYDYFSDKPGTTYGNILPFSKNDQTGETSLAWPEIVRSPMRGLSQLMAEGAGEGRPGEEVTPDTVGAVMLMSPMSAASHAALPAEAAGTSLVDSAKNTNLVKGATARTGDELERAAEAIKGNSSALYAKSRDLGAVLNADAAAKGIASIEQSLGRISPRRQGDTLSVLNDMKEAASKGNLSLEDLDDFRQDFRDVHNDHTDFTGHTKSDGYKASQAINGLDDWVNELGPEHLASGDPAAIDALNSGRQQWAQYRKFDSIANVVKQADGDPNKLKAGLTRFLNKTNNTRGFSDDEISALQTAARNSTGEKLLKSVGKFGIDLGSSLSPGNTALPALTGFTGLGMGTGHGIPMVAAGTMARQAQKYLARGKAENLLSTIEGNAQSSPALQMLEQIANPGKAAGGRIPSKSEWARSLYTARRKGYNFTAKDRSDPKKVIELQRAIG